MLKFGKLFEIAKYWQLTIKVSAYGVRQGAPSLTFNFGTPPYLRN